MSRGCNDEVQYFVNDPLPIFSYHICGIGACKYCFNSESTTSKSISLCLGCEDSLHSKCVLPQSFYIKKVYKKQTQTIYPSNDIRNGLPSQVIERLVIITQAESQASLPLGQASPDVSVIFLQPKTKKQKCLLDGTLLTSTPSPDSDDFGLGS